MDKINSKVYWFFQLLTINELYETKCSKDWIMREPSQCILLTDC